MAVHIPQVPLASALTIYSAIKSNRWLLITYLRAAAERLLNYLLIRLTDLRFISYAIGISLFLLAILGVIEMVCIFTFRVAVAALEKFLRDTFWAAHLVVSVVLIALMGCAIIVGLKGNGEVDGEGGDGCVMEGFVKDGFAEKEGVLVEVEI